MTNCINNIINSQNQDGCNPAALNLFKKEKSSSRYIEAPKTLPKYSMYRELQKQDEFRKNAITELSLQKSRKKFSPKAFLVVLAAVTAAAAVLIKEK